MPTLYVHNVSLQCVNEFSTFLIRLTKRDRFIDFTLKEGDRKKNIIENPSLLPRAPWGIKI